MALCQSDTDRSLPTGSASQMDRIFSVVFRCDGSEQIGLGHVSRCLGLARQLQAQYGCWISFLMKWHAVATSMVAGEGFFVVVFPDDTSPREQGRWLKRVCRHLEADLIILDIRDDLPRHVVQDLRQAGVLCATIDDPTDRRLDADWAFYPPVPQVKRWDWTGFSGCLRVGWDWVLLKPDFAEPFRKSIPHDLTILVTMGGTDPLKCTEKVVEALVRLETPCRAIVVLGRGYGDDRTLQNVAQTTQGMIEIRRDVKNMAALMAEVDLAIASFGVTAYELAARGVPGLYLGFTADHVESATLFETMGLGKSLGLQSEVTIEEITSALKGFLEDSSTLHQTAEHARQIVDGRGAARIADLLVAGLKEHHVSFS